VTRARALDTLLRAEGKIEPPPGLEDRLWATLADKLANNVPPASGIEAPPLEAALQLPLSKSLIKLLIKGLAGLALLLVAGELLTSVAGTERAAPGELGAIPGHELSARQTRLDASARRPVAAELDEPLLPESQLEPHDPSPRAPVATEPRKRPKSSSPRRRPREAPHHEPPEARSEIAVIRALRDAMRRGDLQAALVEIAGHQRTFGDAGQLAQERLAYHVEVLCGLGRDDAAKALAAEFIARWPESAHRPRVETSCP